MRILIGSFLAALAAAPAVAGELYGTVQVDSSFYADAHSRSAHRLALAPTAQRPPAGLVVMLESDTFSHDKFDKPKQPLHIDLGPFGFDPPLGAVQAGTTLEIENHLERAVQLKAEGLTFETLAAKGKATQTLDKPGRFIVRDADEPLHTLTAVVAPSIYVIQLDDTGEFAFDELSAGDYRVRLFGFDPLLTSIGELSSALARVDTTGRTTVKLTLPHEEKKQ
jgi:hypothetical protein